MELVEQLNIRKNLMNKKYDTATLYKCNDKSNIFKV